MFQLREEDGVATLYRIAKSGRESEVLKVIGTDAKRVLVIDKSKYNSLRFKSEAPIHLLKSGSNFIATITGKLRVYKLPHFMSYHNEVLNANGAMLHHATAKNINTEYIQNNVLDYDVLLDNMLEYVAEV